jgi:hypothetical protein
MQEKISMRCFGHFRRYTIILCIFTLAFAPTVILLRERDRTEIFFFPWKATDAVVLHETEVVERNTSSNCTNRNLHYDGYDTRAFGNAVFSDFAMGGPRNNCSVLLIGMHGTINENANQFPGIVVYLNGEVHAHKVSNRHFYLGPQSVDVPENISFLLYYVSFAFLELGQPSFIQRKEDPRSEFLLYVSSRCLDHRESAFDALSNIGEVHATGKCHGKTSNYKQVKFESIHNWMDSYSAYEEYRFALAMENTKQAGYVTEKILNAFIGGAVPIYWGTTDVFDIFNRNAFIYFDPENPNDALDRVRYLEYNVTAYKEMRQHPIFATGALQKYFSLADNIADGALKRKIRHFLGIHDP